MGAELSKHGLRYDDLLDPSANGDVEEAIRRLPQEERDMRQQRLKRAMDLSMKHKYLDKETMAKQTPFLGYITPVLREVGLALKKRVCVCFLSSFCLTSFVLCWSILVQSCTLRCSALHPPCCNPNPWVSCLIEVTWRDAASSTWMTGPRAQVESERDERATLGSGQPYNRRGAGPGPVPPPLSLSVHILDLKEVCKSFLIFA